MFSFAPLSALALIGIITLGMVYQNYSQGENDLYALAETEQIRLKVNELKPLNVDTVALPRLFKHDLKGNADGDLINVYDNRVAFEVNADTGAPKVRVTYPVPKRSCPRYVQHLIQTSAIQITIESYRILGASTSDEKQRILDACQLASTPTIVFSI